MGKITFEKILVSVIIGAVVLAVVFIIYLFIGNAAKSIRILSPNGQEEWEIGNTYKIIWKAKGLEKVGIVIFKGQEPKWIFKDVPASAGSYGWKIYPGQVYGDDYWVAVFEYPWKKGNVIDYSDTSFSIVYSELSNCDTLSIQNQSPYVASDYPDVRKVFITRATFNGNLGGFEGADKKCQEEAVKLGFKGNWFAFLGGDNDKDVLIERMKKMPLGIDGIFVEAQPEATLIRGTTCHHLIGSNLIEFISVFSNLAAINEQNFQKDFLEKIKTVWLGRIDVNSKKNCIPIASFMGEGKPLEEKYTFTASCQSWTAGSTFVDGYPVPQGSIPPNFDQCHVPKLINAVSLGALSSGSAGNYFTPNLGKSCSASESLVCVEQ